MGAGFVPVDLPNCAETRAKSLAEYCSWHATVERSSAAWVHGATAREPWPHTIAIDADARFALPRSPEFLVREVRIPRQHVIEVGGVRVTTALRTAIDLARTTPRHPDSGAAARQPSERARAREWEMSLRETLWRLMVRCGATHETITRELSRSTNLPNRHLARARLLAALPCPTELPQSRLPTAG